MSSPIDHQRFREGLAAWYSLRWEIGKIAVDDEVGPSESRRSITGDLGMEKA